MAKSSGRNRYLRRGGSAGGSGLGGGNARAQAQEMLARAPQAMTVPQIFIGDVHVGGSDDLAALEREGKLDALLAG